MRYRLVLPAVFTALALSGGHVTAAQPTPQVTDPKGDANFTGNAAYNQVTPVGSQDYADVTSILWQTTKKTTVVRKKRVTTVTGFTVTVTLAGPLNVPSPTSLVFRILGTPACNEKGFFGVVYYTSKSTDPAVPQSAIRDNCINNTTRLTPIAMPVIQGNTIVWSVPLSAIPKDTKVGVGSTLTGLWFEVRELQDFRGACVPKEVPSYGGACGLAVGIVDNSRADAASYRIGS